MNETMWVVRHCVWLRAATHLWARGWSRAGWHLVDRVMESLDD